MTAKYPEIQFKLFLYAVLVGNLIYATPTIIGILLFNLIDIDVFFYIFIPIALISIPISAFMSWLIAKGSNWENTSAAIIATIGVPGLIYAFFFGGLLGFHLFGKAGGILLAILFYLLARLSTIPLGKKYPIFWELILSHKNNKSHVHLDHNQSADMLHQ